MVPTNSNQRKHYKIHLKSENMFRSLLKLFGLVSESREEENKRMEALIDNDPVLNQLQKDLRAINDQSKAHLDKVKIRNPKLYKWLEDAGMINNLN